MKIKTCLYLIILMAFLQVSTSAIAAKAEVDTHSQPVTAWPLLYHKAENGESVTDVLWPLFHHESDKDSQRFAIRPFLFSWEKGPKDELKASFLWPLNIYDKKEKSTLFHSFPFYWYGKAPSHNHNVLFPFYWDIHSKGFDLTHYWPLYGEYTAGDYKEVSTLFPFFRYGKNKKTNETLIQAPWPLFHYHKKPNYFSTRLLPLYAYEKTDKTSTGFVIPYFWKNETDKKYRGIPPLWYSEVSRDRAIDLVFPLYFNMESQQYNIQFITPLYSKWKTERSRFKTFLPLYYNFKKENAEASTILPFYFSFAHNNVKFKSAFPFYYNYEDKNNDTSLNYFFPVYGSYRKQNHISRHFLFFPLYAQHKDKETGYRSWDILWPLFHYGASEDQKNIWALPFFTHIKRPWYELSSVFPFYFSYEGQQTSYRHLLPFYGSYTKNESYSKQFFLGPLYIQTRDEQTGFKAKDFLFPLCRFQSQGDDRLNWLFPFYFNMKSDQRRIKAIVPFYFSGHDDKHDLTATLIPPTFSLKKKDFKTFHAWPFYGITKDKTYVEHSVLWPLIRYGNDTASDHKYRQVVNWIYKKENKKTEHAFIPLWYHSKSPDNTIDASLFLHAYSKNKLLNQTDFSFLWLIPHKITLFHLQKTPGRIEHALFPLYRYASNASEDSRSFELLWPFFNSSKKGAFTKKVSLLSGFISYEKENKTDKEFRFLWRFIRTKKTATSKIFEFNPLYYRRVDQQKGSYWAILGGLIGRSKAPDGSTDMKFLWFF